MIRNFMILLKLKDYSDKIELIILNIYLDCITILQDAINKNLFLQLLMAIVKLSLLGCVNLHTSF